MKALFTVLALYAVPFLSLAQDTIWGPDSIYGTSSNTSPKLVSSHLVNCDTFGSISPDACAAARCQAVIDSSTENVIYSNCHVNTYQNGALHYYVGYSYSRKTCSGGTCGSSTTISTGTNMVFWSDEIPTCPNDNAPTYTEIRKIDPTGAGDGSYTYFCYDVTELQQRDTCPDSQSDFDYILPTNGNTAANICQTKPDGSSCAYTLNDEQDPPFYIVNYENGGCYQGTNDEYGLEPDPLPDSPQCQDIGNGVFACLENPGNVCGESGCLAGCGNVNGQFICLTGDNDGDGLGNYFDPDIDGDGIPNGQDTDADGDGTDDPDYGDGPGSGGGTTVIVDNTGVEQRLDAIKGLLSQPYTGMTGTQFQQAADAQTDGLITDLTEAANKDITELGGVALQSSDLSFVENVFDLQPGTCQNPEFPYVEFDICGQVGVVQELLYWLLAAFTTIAIWRELNETLRM